MSSAKACEKHVHRKPEGSYATLIGVGLVGPKSRGKPVGDGQLVNIPAPPILAKPWGTQEARLSVPNGHGAFPTLEGVGGVEGRPEATQLKLGCQEKPIGLGISVRTVNRHW